MDFKSLEDAAVTILQWDESRVTRGMSPEPIRIVMAGHSGEVAIERLAPAVFRVTTGDHHSKKIYRSRTTCNLAEAAHLFVDAVVAQTVGFNLGSDQRDFEQSFDPPAESSADQAGFKERLLATADHFEALSKTYRDRAAEYRQYAGNE